jgi:hypothetical protein
LGEVEIGPVFDGEIRAESDVLAAIELGGEGAGGASNPDVGGYAKG